MFKPFSLLFFVAVFTWIVRIFLTTDGSERIARTCEPVEIFGRVSISATALVADQFTGDMQQLMNTWVYGCRYMVWRSTYEEDYLRYLQEVEASEKTKGAPAKPAKDEKKTKNAESARTEKL